MDYAPSVNFRSSAPNFETEVSNIPFGNNSTNTSEGLYQAYAKVQALNETGALNVIVLLTDGRPSGLTVQVDAQGSCASKGLKPGLVAANVGQSWPPIPPTTWGGRQDAATTIWTFGLFDPHYTGSYGGADSNFVAASAGCHYATDPGQPILGGDLYLDAPTLPLLDAHGNSTTGPVATGAGQSLSSPQAVRYAAMNAADNMATRIRQDTTVRPILFVIG